VLASLQRQLERIYEVEIPHRVDDFLITDPGVLNDIHGHEGPAQSEVEEQLLVVQDGDCLDIALYVDNEVVNRLTRDDPRSRLHAGNLADYCTALEGVSHLEMQAEIDKYVGTAFLFGQQRSGRIPSSLYSWLFENPEFDSSLDRTSLERYRDANYYASKYCARLENRYLKADGRAGMFNDLRRLYRLTNYAKINCAVEKH
jgi:hypothetical protein